MSAKDFMTRDVACITPDASLREAHDIMRSLDVRHLPVVAGTSLLGVLSDRDVLPHTRDGEVCEELIVEEVMSESPIVAQPRASVAHIADLMLTHRIDCVPVVNADRLVGIVTSTDLIALLCTPPDGVAKVLPFTFNVLTPEATRALRAR